MRKGARWWCGVFIVGALTAGLTFGEASTLTGPLHGFTVACGILLIVLAFVGFLGWIGDGFV